MPFQPGQSGNPSGGTSVKLWRDAIRAAMAERERTGKPGALRDLAGVLIDKALEGDLVALKEIGDRTDGKVPQALTQGEEGPWEMLIRWASEKS